MRMAYGAIVSRCAATLSSAHYLCRSIPPPSSTLHLLPAALSARIHGKLRCPVAAAAGGQLLHDAGTTALVFGGAYGLVSTFDNLTRRKIIDQKLSRKLVHILSGLLFLASWPIFSTSTGARYLAALVPCVNCFRLVINGLSLSTDEGLIKSVSREGKPEELLGGPLYYVLVLILCAVVFWCDSPVGMISLSMMCAGDGIADIMGRRFGSTKLPYNPHKSWAGSISMFLFGFLVSISMLYYFSVLGYVELDWTTTVGRVALVSLVATFVESLPTNGIVDDNISVPLASMVASYFIFGW
ncbi:probable phytol kinase 1, chloroplastic [Salvia splendens]|uniref:probable phytol kinase 1, chloroplastic n=1 Tax=Salvia splendens TaxID=180675 RepID=UPI001C25F624|nr:probable phytol kinase 1, chloroplastic [Salvia splendens]